MQEQRERWLQLCEQAATEQDPEKLMALIAEINRLLGFAEEKSIREIAQVLGRSEGAVKQLQFRALQNLRARMEGAHA